MTPFIWKNALRTEIVTTGHGFVISYDLNGQELWRVGGMSMPTPSPLASDGLLYVGTGAQGDANRPFLAIKPGASGDISLQAGARSNDFIAWSQPARLGLHAVSARARRSGVPRARHRDPDRPERENRRADLQSASRRGRQHVLGFAGRRREPHLLLTEEGLTFVLEAGGEYKEVARNDLSRDVAGISGPRRRRDLHPHGVEAVQDRRLTSVLRRADRGPLWRSRPASWWRNKPTSVTRPIVCDDPRSASFVTTAGLMSTQITGTQAGSMLPTPIPCSIVERTMTMPIPSSAAA